MSSSRETAGTVQPGWEANKAITRNAIVETAMGLVRAKGPGGFTVDDIAAAAGVSRRTFFNYFPSREAALVVSIEDFLDHAADQFLSRPAEEPLVDSMHQVLTALADPIHLAAMAEVYGLAGTNAQMNRFQLEGWENCADRLVAAIGQRPGAGSDPLYANALVGSVLSSGKAALSQWYRRTGGDVTEESLVLLRQLLVDVVGYLRHGFTR
ncbi:DNA-binding transcriptional regulator, AcrR family [Arthrobacter subterraneus]|uniref:DNA-binding transcriptional regulator, AcrR family n=1 Tax=Arthrobacter subterraneus TaxID=335973 RepID=A0A1G8NWK3_9MICC|nr:TetR family transcriptional regulator [Arthrobacter subterraneus]SDI83880.1 DNA-binding transcriptional regulator, AcrR family [Arthrobacter subterraneus]